MMRIVLKFSAWIGVLVLVGCSPAVITPPTRPPAIEVTASPTSEQAVTASPTLRPSTTPRPTHTPTATTIPTLTAFPPLPKTPIGTSIGVVTPAAATAQATYAYREWSQFLAGVPADTAAWDTYLVPYANLLIPIPPGWTITQWPVSDTMLFFYSASVQPPCQPPCPEIGITVWRTQTETLESWLDQHSTTGPFGTVLDDKPYLHYFGVFDVTPMSIDGRWTCIRFRHDSMSVPVITLVTRVEGVFVSLSATHFGTEFGGYTDLAYLTQMMLTGAFQP